MYPDIVGGWSPHLRPLAEAIIAAGWEIIPLTRDQVLDPGCLKDSKVAILHLHWPTSIFPIERYRISRLFPFNYFASWWAVRQIDDWAQRVEESHLPVVWQIHDLGSHHLLKAGPLATADEHLHRTLYRLSNAVVIHEHSCLKAISELYGPPPLFAVAPLGDYTWMHGAVRTKEEARRSLGLDKWDKVLAYVGTARRNRNPAEVARAFSEVAGPKDCLMIAGQAVARFVKPGRDPRIQVLNGLLPDATLRDIFCASDFVINHAQRYLTSAVVRAAISYGVPVVTYPYGTSLDMARGAAIFIDEESGGLDRALQRALAVSPSEYEALAQAARERNVERTWEQAGMACADLYNRLIEAGKSL